MLTVDSARSTPKIDMTERRVVWLNQTNDSQAREAENANLLEAERVLQICNACRYCEGFCAVFPAMTRRLAFNEPDIHYLANLCHNCGACLHACQYAPPHEFALNVPQTMAKVRGSTYQRYAWPGFLGRLYQSNGVAFGLIIAVALAVFLLMAINSAGGLLHEPLQGDFYAIFPHNTLVVIFGITFLFSVLAIAIGITRFWRSYMPGPVSFEPLQEASKNVLQLTYLDGGHGEGCNEQDDRFTLWRRRFHHFTFYGFMLCFAATCVATVYHYVFGWIAPYAYTSLPVMLGTVGGIGLLIGPAGLAFMHFKRSRLHQEPSQKSLDLGFIVMLFLVSLTGLLLMILRDTAWMGIWLSIHLAMVFAFFVMMPYSKFAHGFYRGAALLKHTIEKRKPREVQLPE